ncbi:MAG: hypothetical protein Fur0046_06610 [Cyanobacteria bacterium J069]|nr:MAG: hypothetical protein D6742_06965 [Cyanobacteria bacterium J069]
MKRQIYIPQLPLAVYREVAAHLRQVPGVSVVLLPQTASEFDYRQSQVGGLEIENGTGTAGAQQQVERILNHYADRFGTWQAIASMP